MDLLFEDLFTYLFIHLFIHLMSCSAYMDFFIFIMISFVFLLKFPISLGIVVLI